MMNKWISVKEQLPPDDTIVKVQTRIFFKTRSVAMYFKGYFVNRGKNITRWVTHWQPTKNWEPPSE